jgi:hypothetical protein
MDWQRLHALTLGSAHVTSRGVSQLLEQLPLLTTLDLRGCPGTFNLGPLLPFLQRLQRFYPYAFQWHRYRPPTGREVAAMWNAEEKELQEARRKRQKQSDAARKKRRQRKADRQEDVDAEFEFEEEEEEREEEEEEWENEYASCLCECLESW